MNKTTSSLCLLLISLIFYALPAHSQMSSTQDWKGFRGVDAAGKIADMPTPDQWPAEGLNIRWEKEFGDSFSEISVANGKAFVTHSEKIDSASGFEYVSVLNAGNGELLYRTKIDSLFIDTDNWGNGPRATPAIADGRAFLFSGFGKLIAMNIENGNILWQRDFMSEFGSTLPRWGYSSSPLLIDDMVIMEIGGTEDRALGAFEQATGKLLWTGARGNSGYCSPVAVNIDERLHILYASGTRLYAFDKKGDTILTCQLPLSNPMAVPVFMPPNKLFFSAVRSTGFCVVEIDGTKAEVTNSGSTMKNDFSSSCYHEGYIYGFNVAALQCIDPATGEKKWVKRGYGKGSLICLGDKLVILSDKGRLVYAKATPEAYIELGAFDALTDRCWTAPAFAAGRLYVRNLSQVICFDFGNTN